MRIVAVANQKGGCGKTTTAVNLAGCLAFLGKRVLVVDLDSQGHAGLGLGVTPESLELTLYDLLSPTVVEPPPAAEVVLKISQNLHLMPAGITLSALEQELAGADARELRLRRILEQLDGAYDFVFIDCAPGLGILLFNALAASTEVLVPVEPSRFAVHGLDRFLETVRLAEEIFRRRYRVHAVINNYDGRPETARRFLRQTQARLGSDALRTVIRRNPRLADAAAAGKAISQFDRGSLGFQDFMACSAELIERAAQARPADRWIARLEAPFLENADDDAAGEGWAAVESGPASVDSWRSEREADIRELPGAVIEEVPLAADDAHSSGASTRHIAEPPGDAADSPADSVRYVSLKGGAASADERASCGTTREEIGSGSLPETGDSPWIQSDFEILTQPDSKTQADAQSEDEPVFQFVDAVSSTNDSPADRGDSASSIPPRDRSGADYGISLARPPVIDRWVEPERKAGGSSLAFPAISTAARAGSSSPEERPASSSERAATDSSNAARSAGKSADDASKQDIPDHAPTDDLDTKQLLREARRTLLQITQIEGAARVTDDSGAPDDSDSEAAALASAAESKGGGWIGRVHQRAVSRMRRSDAAPRRPSDSIPPKANQPKNAPDARSAPADAPRAGLQFDVVAGAPDGDSSRAPVHLNLRGPVKRPEGIEFALHAPGIRKAEIAGDFNDWQPEPMEPADPDAGLWRAIKPLNRGSHRYKFVINGKWINDPANRITRPNPFGGTDSIVDVS